MNLTLKQKLGQKLIFGFHGTTLSQSFKNLLREYQIGNVILFARNVASAEQLRSLCRELTDLIQENTGLPPFIVIDQEGGMVSRLPKDAVNVPCSMALGATGNPENAALAAGITIRQLRGLGPNFNMAPVLDVNTNAKNPVIGIRSFSDDPHKAAAFGTAAVRAYQDSGILCCGKHFPGHGDTAVDSHLGLPRVDKSLDELERGELIPFRAAIAAGIPAIMSSHILFPQLEPEKIPCTMSRKILTGLLRERLGFRGLILSDCMEMNAIKDYYGTANGVVAGIRAGLDLAEISATEALMWEAARALNRAGEAGELNPDEIDASVERILAAKQSLKQYPLIPELCNRPEDYALSCQLSRESITHYAGPVPCIDENTFFCGCADYRSSGVANDDESTYPFPMFLGKALGCDYQVTGKNPDDAEIQALVEKAGHYRNVVLSTCNAHLFPGQLALVQALHQTGKELTVVALRNPYDLPLLPEGTGRFAIYDYSPEAFQALISVFQGKPAPGHLPVTLS